MRRTLILLAFVTGLVAACSGSAATGGLPAGGTGSAPTQAGATQGGATQGATVAPATPAGPPQQLDACTLITTAEASAALGGEPVDAGVVPTPGAHSCLFAGHPAQGLDLNAVEISLTGAGVFKPGQKSVPGLTFTPVSGVGDAAYYVSLSGIGTSSVVLNVQKGQTTFTTSVLLKGASDSQLMDAEKTLAMAILGRI
jgi:hypothetical protein